MGGRTLSSSVSAPSLSGSFAAAKGVAASPIPPMQGRRPQWDSRHQVPFSQVNAKLTRNTRSYFDRPRESESYGLRHDPPLRTHWQLQDGSSENSMSQLTASAASPQASQSAASSPEVSRLRRRELSWQSRHRVIFEKDNNHYHPNFRAYFARPKSLLH